MTDGEFYSCFNYDNENLKDLKEAYRERNFDAAAEELAKRSRKTPRIANRLFKRVRDFALVNGDSVITKDIAETLLDE